MKKSKLCLAFFAAIFSLAWFNSCTVKPTTAATDLVITNPRDVKVIITFNYAEMESSSTISGLSLIFKDNNDHNVRILEGYVKINGIALLYEDPNYYSNNVVVDPNSHIQMKIKLADTTKYIDSILTPNYNIIDLEMIPDSSNINDTIIIPARSGIDESNIASIKIGDIITPFKINAENGQVLILPVKNSALKGKREQIEFLFYYTETVLPQFKDGSFIEFKASFRKGIIFY